jgi:hypothetical protein
MNKTSMVRRTDDARQARVPLTQSGQAAASNIKHAPLLLPVDSQRAPLGRGACGPGLARSGPSGAPCPSTRCRTRTRGRLGPPQAGPAFAPRPPGWRQSSALAGLAGRSPTPRPRPMALPGAGGPTRRAPGGGDSLLCHGPPDTPNNSRTPHCHMWWGISPAHHADLVAPMEEGVALSQRPEDPRHPLVHRDAKPVPLLKETRAPWPAKPGTPPRDEDADERGGTATVLVLTEPRTGWRTIDISGQRPAVDGAPQSTQRLDDGSPEPPW